jgi:Ca2+-binding EF-hand superfamily protein
MPGYGGCVQHEYNKIANTFGKAAQASYIEALNLKYQPPNPLKKEDTYTANDYYVGAPDPRKKTNSKNRSNLTLGDPRAQTFDTINMTAYRMRDLPMTRAPLVDGFAEMPSEARDKVYRRALERCGVEGVRKLEHDIRVKIEQRTSGGPFALRKAFKYFDRDGSGDIDPDEFYAAMDWFWLQFTEDGVLALFGLYDEDRGGSLGYYEFVENLIDGFGKGPAPTGGLKDKMSALFAATKDPPSTAKSPKHVNIDQARQAFDYCDANGSGRIELTELDGVLRTLGMSTDSDLVNQAMLVLDKDGSGDVSFDEFWEWWQYAITNSRKKGRGGAGDQGSPSSKSRHGDGADYDRAALERMGTGGRPAPLSGSFLGGASPNTGRRSPWGGAQSPYGGSKSPMMGARFAESARGTSPAQQYGDVLSGSPAPMNGVPKWSPPKAGSPIRRI